MFEQIKSFFHLAEIGQSRSSITNPLQWTMVILVGGILLMSLIGLPLWIITSLLCCLFVVLGLFVYAYLYFMHKAPDVLRSEHYHLSKMAIEHGLVGDDIHGLFEEGEENNRRIGGQLTS